MSTPTLLEASQKIFGTFLDAPVSVYSNGTCIEKNQPLFQPIPGTPEADREVSLMDIYYPEGNVWVVMYSNIGTIVILDKPGYSQFEVAYMSRDIIQKDIRTNKIVWRNGV